MNLFCSEGWVGMRTTAPSCSAWIRPWSTNRIWGQMLCPYLLVTFKIFCSAFLFFCFIFAHMYVIYLGLFSQPFFTDFVAIKLTFILKNQRFDPALVNRNCPRYQRLEGEIKSKVCQVETLRMFCNGYIVEKSCWQCVAFEPLNKKLLKCALFRISLHSGAMHCYHIYHSAWDKDIFGTVIPGEGLN